MQTRKTALLSIKRGFLTHLQTVQNLAVKIIYPALNRKSSQDHPALNAAHGSL